MRGPGAPGQQQPPVPLAGAKRTHGPAAGQPVAKRGRIALDAVCMNSHIATAKLALRELRKQMAEREDDDEVQFEQKERRRQAKDMAKLKPILLGGPVAGEICWNLNGGTRELHCMDLSSTAVAVMGDC